MTEEERKRLAKKRQAELKAKNLQSFNMFRKTLTGTAAGKNEIESSMADFVAKMGGSVSEEELKKIKALLPKR